LCDRAERLWDLRRSAAVVDARPRAVPDQYVMSSYYRDEMSRLPRWGWWARQSVSQPASVGEIDVAVL